MKFESFHWLSHHGLWTIIPCSKNWITVHMILWDDFVFIIPCPVFYYIFGAFLLVNFQTCWISDDDSQLGNTCIWFFSTVGCWLQKGSKCQLSRDWWVLYLEFVSRFTEHENQSPRPEIIARCISIQGFVLALILLIWLSFVWWLTYWLVYHFNSAV